MDEKKEAFKKKLNELVRLLQKLRKSNQFGAMEGIPNMDPFMHQQFEMLFKNDSMKDHLTDELFDKFGDQMLFMITQAVDQLKEQFGDELEYDMEDDPQETVDEYKADSDVKDLNEIGLSDPSKEIAKIDERLKKGNLSPEEIDQLLDQRSKLTGSLD